MKIRLPYKVPLALVTACAATLLFFNNCSQIGTSAAYTAASSVSQCVTHFVATKLATYDINTTCANPGNYVCNEQISGPDVAAFSGARERCANLSTRSICLNVDVNATAGSVSQTSVHCANTAVVGVSGYLFQADAGSFEEALSSVIAKCQSRSM